MPETIIRGDISTKLIHLTRDTDFQTAAKTLLSILNTKKLLGSTVYIKGGHTCVCFSEAPIANLSQILAFPSETSGMRYKPFGIMVDKKWLYAKGGLPVIYQPDRYYNLLHDDLQYRHVRFEPHNNIDYTWEREWRIRTAELEFDTNDVTVILPNRAWADWMRRQRDTATQIGHIVTGGFGAHSPSWHSIVLEDLGVLVPNIVSP